MSGKSQRTQLSGILNSLPEPHTSPELDLKSVELEEIVESFADGSKSFEERKKFRDELCRRDRDLGREAITNICRSYEYSASKDLLAFICFLFDSETLDIFEKMECSRTLQEAKHPSVRDYWIKVLREFQEQNKENRPSISLYIDMLRFLMDGKFEDRVVDCVKWLCRESPAAFLYRTIVSIHRESSSPDNPDQISPRRISEQYQNCLYLTFFYSVSEDQYKILSAQYLLNNNLDKIAVEDCLLLIARDLSRQHQIRADAADTLLKSGSSRVREQCMNVLKELGRDLSQAPSIGSNRENVHLFDESVNEFLSRLGGMKLATINKNDSEQIRSFDDVVDLIRNTPQYQESKESQDAINSSLLRIRIDQVLYPGSQTLSTIFLRIFQTIEQHENKELLTQRLLEELIDMANTCSTGHASRLVNVFSGIDGFLLRVSWKEQIASNVAGRLTALAKVAKDEETRKMYSDQEVHLSDEQLEKIDQTFRAFVLEEMAETSIENRLHWNQFFRGVVGSLIEDMKKEFVESGHVGLDDFVLYFREAIVFYETGIQE